MAWVTDSCSTNSPLSSFCVCFCIFMFPYCMLVHCVKTFEIWVVGSYNCMSAYCMFVYCVFAYCVFAYCVFAYCVFAYCVFAYCVFAYCVLCICLLHTKTWVVSNCKSKGSLSGPQLATSLSRLNSSRSPAGRGFGDFGKFFQNDHRCHRLSTARCVSVAHHRPEKDCQHHGHQHGLHHGHHHGHHGHQHGLHHEHHGHHGHCHH